MLRVAHAQANVERFDFHAGILTTDRHGVKPRSGHAAIRGWTRIFSRGATPEISPAHRAGWLFQNVSVPAGRWNPLSFQDG
jgi:hypothetical protein